MSLTELVRQRWRLAIALSAAIVIVYFGFVLLVAFDKPLVATRLAPGLSLGILLGALVILASWLVTWIYVRWANAHFDRRVQALRAGRGGDTGGSTGAGNAAGVGR
ncbi:MAG: DUF485 domain-containing protein [Gammaproteobacteria bacterium]|nr:DUF485 domain-containing protein [Gammaproteobacteria bacterium]